MIQHIASWLSLFFYSIILHELGHFLYFQVVLKRKVEMRFHFTSPQDFGLKTGYPLDYRMTDHKYIELLLSGIFAGIIPIALAVIIMPLNAVVLPFYFVGCWKDIKNIWRMIP